MAITDPIALGFEAIAWVSIDVLPAEPLKSFAESLANLPSVAYVTICAGEYDIVAEVVCRNQSELFDVIENDIRQLRNIDNAEVLLCDDLFYRRVIPA